jgi:hypothetical protein
MAHGEAIRPLESTDGSPVDVEQVLGNKSLVVTDNRTNELLELILAELKDIKLALFEVIEE